MRPICLLIAFCLAVPDSLLIAQTAAPSPGTESDAVDLHSTKRITIHLKSALPSVAISTIAEQSGVPMQLMVINAGPYLPPFPVTAHDFDAQDEPLAIALLHLSKLYALTQSKMYGEDSVMFVTQQPVDNPFAKWRSSSEQPALPPSSITGPFAVVADQMTLDRWMDPLAADEKAKAENSNPSVQKQVRLQLLLTVLAEPGITILSMPTEPVVDTFVDDQNRLLWDAPPDLQQGERHANDFEDRSLVLTLRATALEATSIASLSGSITLNVVTRSHKYKWDNLDRPGPRTEIVNGLRVTLRALEDDTGTPSQEAVIDVNRNGMDPAAWDELQERIAHGSHIQIFDKAGNLLSDPFRWYPITDGLNLQMMLKVKGKGDHLGDVGRAFKMVWDFPLETGDVKVPFSFTHLPLPH